MLRANLIGKARGVRAISPQPSYFPAQNSLFPRGAGQAAKSQARQAGLGGLESDFRFTGYLVFAESSKTG